MISPSGRVPGRASEPSRTRVGDDGRDGTFRGILLGYLGFSRYAEYMGEDARSVEARGAHTTPRCGPRAGRAKARCGRPVAPLRLPFELRLRYVKLGTSLCVSSNSENISCTTFLEYKNNRKQELALQHLVNRLVPENV